MTFLDLPVVTLSKISNRI